MHQGVPVINLTGRLKHIALFLCESLHADASAVIVGAVQHLHECNQRLGLILCHDGITVIDMVLRIGRDPIIIPAAYQ